MNSFYPKTLTVGDGELTNIAEKIVELQEEAKHSKNPAKEYTIMIQYAQTEPVVFKDKNSGKEIFFNSNPLGLWITIKREDLLKYDDNVRDLLPIVIKQKDIELYHRQTSKDYDEKNIDSKDSGDIVTELNPFDFDNLYTDFRKVLTSNGKKYSKMALFAYGKLHGPEMFFEFIKNMPEKYKDVATAIFIHLFGEQLFDKLAKKDKNKTRAKEPEMEL